VKDEQKNVVTAHYREVASIAKKSGAELQMLVYE